MVLIPSTVLAQNIEAGAPNPDHEGARPEKRLVLQVGAGPSVTSVDAGDVHFISFHVHVTTMVGWEVWKAPLGSDVLSLGLGYVGSLDVNDAELIHRHGFGAILRKGWFYGTLSGGLTLGHDFATGNVLTGGHVAIEPGFRFGRVQLGFPCTVDFLGYPQGMLPASTFAATLGVQL